MRCTLLRHGRWRATKKDRLNVQHKKETTLRETNLHGNIKKKKDKNEKEKSENLITHSEFGGDQSNSNWKNFPRMKNWEDCEWRGRKNCTKKEYKETNKGQTEVRVVVVAVVILRLVVGGGKLRQNCKVEFKKCKLRTCSSRNIPVLRSSDLTTHLISLLCLFLRFKRKQKVIYTHLQWRLSSNL